jgi:predicted N-acetyltransferase YhbS
MVNGIGSAEIIEVPGGDPTFADHGQDISLQLIALPNGAPGAACSLWWSDAPALPGERVGVIGHFAADDTEAGSQLLNAAMQRLAAGGCTIAIGPMDGNTWRRYRLLTERGPRPAFFLEPDNPTHFPECFTRAGLSPLASYYSAAVTDLTARDERVPRVEERLATSGVTIRSIAPDQFEEELRRLHALSLESFRSNFLYTDLSEADFIAQYLAIRPHLVPDLVLLAEQEGRLVGFVFAVPDLAQSMRGEKLNTVIVKTVAVAQGRPFAGLGAVLVDRIHQTAAAMGMREVVHALMHESNKSLNLSSRTAKPFRRYTMYGRKLT